MLGAVSVAHPLRQYQSHSVVCYEACVSPGSGRACYGEYIVTRGMGLFTNKRISFDRYGRETTVFGLPHEDDAQVQPRLPRLSMLV